MEHTSLHFIVVNDPEHDFDLMMEVSMGTDSRSIADIRRISRRWFITFFCQGRELELQWETFQTISQSFADFMQEMDSVSNSEED